MEYAVVFRESFAWIAPDNET